MSSKPIRKTLPSGTSILASDKGMLTEVEPLSAEVGRLLDEAERDVQNATPSSTKRAYSGDWDRFVRWCEENNASSLPAQPEVIAAYVRYLVEGEKKIATIERALASISVAHRLKGHEPSPTSSKSVRKVVSAQKRLLGTLQRQVSPVSIEHLQRLVSELPGNVAGARDRAVLLEGFAGAFRRSELVSIDVEDIEDVPEGIRILLRASKTDQERRGVWVAIPFGENPETCPVRALRAWLEVSGIRSGPVFRRVDRHGHVGQGRLSPKSVALIVKRAAKLAGYDPAKFSGHSLRSGLATAAAAAGKSERVIMKQTRHRSVTQVRRYIQDGEAFTENAADGLL